MLPLRMILLILSIVFLTLCAFGVSHPRLNFGWLGLALYVLAVLIA